MVKVINLGAIQYEVEMTYCIGKSKIEVVSSKLGGHHFLITSPAGRKEYMQFSPIVWKFGEEVYCPKCGEYSGNSFGRPWSLQGGQWIKTNPIEYRVCHVCCHGFVTEAID